MVVKVETPRLVTPPFSLPRLKKTVPAMNDCAKKVFFSLINDIIVHQCSPQLIGYLHSQEQKEVVDGLSFSKKYFLSCIASVGFGLDVDCFGEKKSSFEKNTE